MAGILIAVFLLGAAVSAAQAESAEGSPGRSPFASVKLSDAMFGIVADSVSSVSIAVSPNATQDEPVTITVSGEAEAARKLFVYVSTAGACASEPATNAGEPLSVGGGEELGEGSFEKTYEYTPGSVGSYTVCAYVDEAEAVVPDATGEGRFEAVRPTGSVAIQVSLNPTQDVPVTIVVSGETEVARKLFVYVSAGGVCASDPASSAGEPLSAGGGEALVAGSFEEAYKYTPASVGSYTVCAYVDEAEAAVPNAAGEESFNAARPAGSVAVQVSPNPTQDKPVTITVSGETEVARKLFVYISSAGLGCESDPAAESGGQWLSGGGGEVLSPGSFKKAYKYTPASVGSYTVCAYIDEAEAAVPNATGEGRFEAARPSGSVFVAVSANATKGEPVTITVSGESEVPRKLFVLISSAGNGCESDPADSGGEPLSNGGGEALGAGSFKKQYTYTPEFIGTYTVCAFVDETEAATPNASGAASFTSSASQAEVEARERAAEVKSEEEQQAKAKAQAEASAREAAAKAAREAAATAAQAAARAAQEAAARAAQEAAGRATAELAAAQAAKLKAARSKPVARLTVTPVAHGGATSAHPGYTALDVTTSPYAFVTVKLTRNGHKIVRREWGEQPSAVAAQISWSCHKPGGTYHYTVTAWTGVGRKLTRSGRFAPVSAARCHALEQEEARAGKRRQAQAREREAREYDEEIARRVSAEREEREREESNCRQEGGTPTIVVGSEGARWVCEGPSGGTLPIS